MGRKEAIREYKERKLPQGVFAMRSTTGEVWVGWSLNLDAARNGLWFGLKHGMHRDKVLQALWNTHGEQAFQFEILEKLEEDVAPIGLKDLLKEKARHWVAQLNGKILLA